MMRIFFAIAFPDEIKNNFEKILSQLSSNPLVRCKRIEDLHLTLQFLANIRDEDVIALSRSVHQALNKIASFHMQFDTIELFPNDHHPQVISLSIKPNEDVIALSTIIGNEILKKGYAIDVRVFRPHITLASIRQAISLTELVMPSFELILVSSVGLYQSQSTAQGSHYQLLEKFSLQSDSRN